MGRISLLDCTLRDGGYVNNWRFGSQKINDIIRGLARSGIDIIEIGFLRDEQYDPDRAVFARCEEIKSVIGDTKDVKFAAMIEAKEDVSKHFPLEKAALLKDAGLSFIRIMAWEWKLEEHLEYCKRVKELGIEISIQPTSVVDYTDERFMQLLDMANEIKPFSLYIVDTWGTEMPGKIRHLAEMANKTLDPDIALGYHGHNNKMQGMACLEAILGMDMSRQVLCDVSLGGIGKGPGNLQTEVIADLLNEEEGGGYDVDKLCDLYSKNVSDFFYENPWGYSLYHFIGSRNLVTQNYATYFRQMRYGEDVFYKFVQSLKGREKVVFNREFTENRLKELGLK
ncbi:MAG: hypothetical protein J1F60_00950 [Oscillospiraceae bacterium]|nr:hypothetical protein [Oscillospiraceae bacterium]